MSDQGDQFDPQASRLPPAPGPYPPPGKRRDQISDDLLDRFFDRLLDEAGRRALFEGLRADPARAREVVQTQQVLAQLDDPIVGPDLVGPVLRQIDARQPFMSRGWRRVVTTGRALVAACVLITVAGVALLERYAPELTRTDHAAPIASVVDSSQHAVVHDVDAIVRAGRTLLASDSLTQPAEHATVRMDASRDLARLRSELARTGQNFSAHAGIDDLDGVTRVWTADERDLTDKLSGSGAWRTVSTAWSTAPTTPTPPTARRTMTASVVLITQTGSSSVSIPLTLRISAIGQDTLTPAAVFMVDADPYTMRLRSSCNIEPTIATLVTTNRRLISDEDDEALGLRLVRMDRSTSSRR